MEATLRKKPLTACLEFVNQHFKDSEDMRKFLSGLKRKKWNPLGRPADSQDTIGGVWLSLNDPVNDHT